MTAKRRRLITVAAAVLAGLVVSAVLAADFSRASEPGSALQYYQPDGPLHEDRIIMPAGLGTMRTDLRDIHDNPVGVACSTCHADMQRDRPPADFAHELTDFHTDMEFDHGQLACSSCHFESDRDKLQLAGGRAIEFADSMQLCAQCHGSTYRSYEHGAHGGMKGYWDQSKGERERNHCLVCHDAHNPAYPPVLPASPPKDRFFSTGSTP